MLSCIRQSVFCLVEQAVLVPIQDVNDRSGLTDSSSDNCSYSAGANTFGGEQWEIEAPLPAHNHTVGQPWHRH